MVTRWAVPRQKGAMVPPALSPPPTPPAAEVSRSEQDRGLWVSCSWGWPSSPPRDSGCLLACLLLPSWEGAQWAGQTAGWWADPGLEAWPPEASPESGGGGPEAARQAERETGVCGCRPVAAILTAAWCHQWPCFTVARPGRWSGRRLGCLAGAGCDVESRLL